MVAKKYTNAQRRQVKKAIELFLRFREEEWEFVDEILLEIPRAAMLIGKCDAIEYTTRRAGKIELYRHEFSRRARPLLASSFDGAQLLLLGGRYNFTEDGITDD